MSNDMSAKIEKFAKMIHSFEEKYGKFDAATCLKCISIAEKQMLAGKYSVESFMRTKEILINSVECKGYLN